MTDHEHQHEHAHPNHHADGTDCSCEADVAHDINGLAIDPVCGMSVEIRAAMHSVTYQERSYYFCSAGCKSKFLSNPVIYLRAA